MNTQQLNQISSALAVDIQSENIKELHGDASTRRYWRLDTKVGSWIISEQDPFPENDDFLNIAEYLSINKITVPEIIKAVPSQGIVILQDLGDQLLYHEALDEIKPENYEEAVDIIIQMQTTLKEDQSCIAYKRAFDKEKWLWELEHTEKYFFGKLLSTGDKAILNQGFEAIASNIQLTPATFCHRDFHSRNLLLHEGRLFVIDFQDARLGPPLYDLASLLRDCYIELPKELEQHLINRYRAGVPHLSSRGAKRRSDLPDFNFEEQYNWTALQRHLKACGTFAYQSIERNNNFYLPFLKHTWDLIIEESESLPELNDFTKHIKAIKLPEFPS